jgi:hypothetical protein
VPSLDLRFADNKSLVDAVTGASPVTFTRASSKTVTNSAGVLETVGIDVPAFDHNPTTLESLGLLVEEQRTNLLLWSEEFNTTWTRANISPFGSGSATDAAVSPDGTQTADLVAVANGASAGAGFVGQTVSKAASAITYTYLVFAKADYYDRAYLHVNDAATNNNRATVIVSLVNGSIEVAAAAVGTFSAASAVVLAFPNGWYRIALTFTTSTETSLLCRLYPANSSADTSDGTRGIFLWGADLQAASTPSSYIPTTTAAVTRSADVASITGSAFSSWYRQDEGTVFVLSDFPLSSFGTSAQLANDSTNEITIRANTPNTQALVVANSANQYVSNIPNTSRFRGALAFKQNNAGFSLNGSVPLFDATTDIPSPTELWIGRRFAGDRYLNGTINRLVFWPQRLANSTLQNITQ